MTQRRLFALSGHWLDRGLSLVCLALGAGVLMIAKGYPTSAGALPMILGWLLMGCGIGLWLFPGKRADMRNVRIGGLLWGMAVFVAVLWLFASLGADVALFVLFVGCAVLSGYPPGLRLVATALLFVILVGAIFGGLLGVPLPGPVFALFSA
ncbi:tripartite tricarboxylate transporter TctB family protein [Halomonas salipaludis]|uniref:DUF1468 domain-containing protein n=1 Tax=Halomonas salipaludis TaxID=2032625 RepID=A0A2A2EX82_9GAMM|nr:tripartite tricarboxylate transporter TctB family protein [Halomonas salipaludis]PAU77150.1 hypothetical protein CK498_07810 [Halomonas salipaludis]